MIETLAMPHAFPMVGAGGLFIMIMGIGVTLGGILSKHRKPLLVLGAAAGSIAIGVSVNALTRPLGLPTPIQYWALAAAILLEVVLIRVVVGRYRTSGEHTLLLAILFVVGFHFLPMAIAFGPLCAILGVTTMANAGAGLWAKRDSSLNSHWIIDGALKIVFGGLMFSAGLA
jgi:hypothetical protein